MAAPDIYQDAALADITLTCRECGTSLDSEDVPLGQPRFPESGYFVALADEAYRLGWLIEYNGPDANYFDYRILCPQCNSASERCCSCWPWGKLYSKGVPAPGRCLKMVAKHIFAILESARDSLYRDCVPTRSTIRMRHESQACFGTCRGNSSSSEPPGRMGLLIPPCGWPE